MAADGVLLWLLVFRVTTRRAREPRAVVKHRTQLAESPWQPESVKVSVQLVKARRLCAGLALSRGSRAEVNASQVTLHLLLARKFQ